MSNQEKTNVESLYSQVCSLLGEIRDLNENVNIIRKALGMKEYFKYDAPNLVGNNSS